ncbi:ESX-5 secretion system eccCb5 domain protein [Mycobacterium kansasii]|uniref:ESX-5 secretion system eccCb5 domain protein n=1 Tax=Mycobacterium kansasii TaxID=1768 RepID=A0A1V3X317_MYCKA|nr:ESX-5 secretion system eccCb5 domain protein [Mycobacterium kansasii]
MNLPAQAGLGYFRRSLEDITRFQAEFLWRDYYARAAPSTATKRRFWCTTSTTSGRSYSPTRSRRWR